MGRNSLRTISFSVNFFNSIKAMFNQWDFWVIFTSGFTPVPYKVFTVTAGVFDINLMMFFIASVVSRGIIIERNCMGKK